jgi:glucose/arabinose dehydrogenase
MRPLLSSAAAFHHNGGHILFGPDRRLYVVIGDRGHQPSAQDLDVVTGKVLRLTAGGKPAPGNPFPDSPVFAYGIRNSFGMAFDPHTGVLWETENGPTCNDELNIIESGANYGWGPAQTCSTPPAPPLNTNRDGPDPVLPVAFYTPTVAPTGITFCDGCRLGRGSRDTLLYGEFKTHDIVRVRLDAGRTAVVGQRSLYHHDDGILSMETAPDGAIHFSDTDGIYRLETGAPALGKEN